MNKVAIAIIVVGLFGVLFNFMFGSLYTHWLDRLPFAVYGTASLYFLCDVLNYYGSGE